MFMFELKVVKRKSYWFISWLWKTLPLTTLGGDICAPLLESELASVQFSSVTQLCPTLCDSMNHSTSGLPVHNPLPEFTQTYVHRVSDAIQPSHPLSSPSPPMSQLFTWGGQSTGVSASASVLPMNTQDWSPLGWTGWISLPSKGLSRIFSNNQFKSINVSVLSLVAALLSCFSRVWLQETP